MTDLPISSEGFGQAKIQEKDMAECVERRTDVERRPQRQRADTKVDKT